MRQKPLRALLALAGILLVTLAAAATSLGLDHNAGWGPGRVLLLVLGVTLIGIACFFRPIAQILGRLPDPRSIMERVAHSRLAASAFNLISRPRPKVVLSLAACTAVMIVAIYVWFVSAGLWTKWPETTNYYGLLAASLRSGQLSLQITPDPALEALANPYDFSARQAVQYPWDAIYYNHRFYLYWGPAPAVVPLFLGLFSTTEIGDQYLVFFFLTALFLTNFALLLIIWRRYFADLPGWAVLLGVLLIGLSSPINWMLNRPEIYEAAIAAGQFFLMGGIFWAYWALERQKPLLFGWAGLFWAMSIGSRTILVFAVFCLAATICWALIANRASCPALVWPGLVALALPLIAGALVLGWYNWARFGSITEFGFGYSLTGYDLRQYANQIFLPRYIISNLWNYLLNPFRPWPDFPFMRPMIGQNFAGYFAPGPQIYLSERITGIVYTFPFLIFLVAPAASLFSRPGQKLTGRDGSLITPPSLVSPRWLYIALLLSGLLTFGLLLGFFYATMRYWADVTPTLVLLSVIGFWQGYRLLARSRLPALLWPYSGLGLALAAISIAVSSLLAFSSYTDRFKDLDPHLWVFLIEFFRKLRF
jgi:hypothetical protein